MFIPKESVEFHGVTSCQNDGSKVKNTGEIRPHPLPLIQPVTLYIL